MSKESNGSAQKYPFYAQRVVVCGGVIGIGTGSNSSYDIVPSVRSSRGGGFCAFRERLSAKVGSRDCEKDAEGRLCHACPESAARQLGSHQVTQTCTLLPVTREYKEPLIFSGIAMQLCRLCRDRSRLGDWVLEIIDRCRYTLYVYWPVLML